MSPEKFPGSLQFEVRFSFFPVNVGYLSCAVAELLGKFEIQPSITQGIEIVILELMGNAVKFCKSFVGLKVSQSNRDFVISVANDFENRESLNRLIGLIDLAAASETPEKFYEQRMAELFTGKNYSSAGLGIYRILCEAQFKLRYTIEKNTITVTAVRMAEVR